MALAFFLHLKQALVWREAWLSGLSVLCLLNLRPSDAWDTMPGCSMRLRARGLVASFPNALCEVVARTCTLHVSFCSWVCWAVRAEHSTKHEVLPRTAAQVMHPGSQPSSQALGRQGPQGWNAEGRGLTGMTSAQFRVRDSAAPVFSVRFLKSHSRVRDRLEWEVCFTHFIRSSLVCLDKTQETKRILPNLLFAIRGPITEVQRPAGEVELAPPGKGIPTPTNMAKCYRPVHPQPLPAHTPCVGSGLGYGFKKLGCSKMLIKIPEACVWI